MASILLRLPGTSTCLKASDYKCNMRVQIGLEGFGLVRVHCNKRDLD